MINHDKENREKIIKLRTSIIRNGMRRIEMELKLMGESLDGLENGFRQDVCDAEAVELVKAVAGTARSMTVFVDALTEKMATEKL